MEYGQPDKISGHFHVAAIPYPGRGHINPMINLCRLLASKGLLISFIVTEEWLDLLSLSSTPLPSNLRFCSIANVIPSERSRGTEFNSFIQAVYTKMEAPVEELLDRIEPPVDSILTSSVLMWVAEIGKRKNIPISSLWTDSPNVLLAFCQLDYLDADQQVLEESSGKQNEALAYLPRVSSSQFNGTSSQTVIRQYKKAFSWFTTSQALLFTSFYELDSHVIDTLRSNFTLPIYPLGPCIPYMTLNIDSLSNANTTHSYFKWLYSQPKCSVLYIALGSFLPISGNQMDEMAIGLQMSGVRFLWVARGETERMQELSGGMGLVVPWCDQLRVLCHPSIGGFLTHCGWNSILEGVYSGLPMLTFPLIWDQYPNSKLIVDDWKVGLRLKNEKEGEKVVGKEEIAKMVRELVDVESIESKGVRKRAEELKEKCQKALEDGGSLSKNLDAFVQGMVSNK